MRLVNIETLIGSDAVSDKAQWTLFLVSGLYSRACLFESYAGLEPAVAIRAGDTANIRMAGIVPRRTELTDLGIMRHAVELAFDPYLPATGSRSDRDSSP